MTESKQWWPEGHSAYDWQTAFSEATWYRAGAPSEHLPEAPYGEEDIASVTAYKVSYEGVEFTPKSGAEDYSTELQLHGLILFRDGTYGALNAGNDYTGWGCQDYSDMRIGTYDQVIRSGMDNEMREALGLAV